MNKQENTLRALGTLLIFGGVALQIAHVTDYGNGHLFTLFGFVFNLLAYVNYSTRLKAENSQLRQRLDAQQ